MKDSILVSGLPTGFSKDKLQIYFQKRKNGGGEVANVQICENGTSAIVEFEEEETISTVLQRKHIFNGRTVKVERYKNKNSNGLFLRVEAVVSPQKLQKAGLKLVNLTQIASEFDDIDIQPTEGYYVITSDSLENLHDFEKKFKELSKKRAASAASHRSRSEFRQPSDRTDQSPIRRSPVAQSSVPIHQEFQPMQTDQSGSSLRPPPTNMDQSPARRQPPGNFNQSNPSSSSHRREIFQSQSSNPPILRQFEALQSATEPDVLIPEWTDRPFPQPQNGQTLAESTETDGRKLIKRAFHFDEGLIQIPGEAIRYRAYQCTVTLPNQPAGQLINQMLMEAFEQRKLFYIGRNISGPGFKIQCSYDMFGSGKMGVEVDLSHKLAEVKGHLNDLGIVTPKPKVRNTPVQKKVPGGPRLVDVPPPEPMYTTAPGPSQQQSPKKVGPFPQPDNLTRQCEYHEKDLPGYPGAGAIHMYFRSPGGTVETEDGQTVRYVSYNRTACLPGSAEGLKLYAMILEATHQKKLFVVAAKAGTFMIRTKVPLMTSDDYPNKEYLQELYAALLKLGIMEPRTAPPLPQKTEAHYEENSDEDEEEQKRLEVLRKGGPFPQPENGVMRMELEGGNLRGFGSGGTVKVYFRFAGGKMKVEGSKPSKSFEVQYSQMNIVAALPGSDNGKRLCAMLKAAFDDKKLFFVEKREGEPSFRVRPHVTLLIAEEYPKIGYLTTLKRELQNLGISEPTGAAVASLAVHRSTTPQGGSLPPEWAAPPSSNPLQPMATDQIDRPLLPGRFSNNGARPKIGRTNSVPVRRSPTQLPPSSRRKTYNQKRPGFAGTFKNNVVSDNFGTGDDSPTRLNSPKQSLSNGGSDSGNQQKEEEEDKCAICLAVLSDKSTKKLPCNHEFHIDCIEMALKTHQKCPYCNQPVNTAGSQAPQTPVFGAAGLGMGGAFGIPRSPSPVYNDPSGGFFQPSTNFPPPFPTYQSYTPPPRNSTSQFGNQRLNGNMSHHTEGRSLPGYQGCGTIVIRYNIPGGIQQSCHPHPGAPYDSTRREAFLPDNAEGQDLLRLLKRAFDSGLTFTIGKSQSSGKDNQIIWNGIQHKTNRHGGTPSYGYPDRNYLSGLRRHLASIGIQ